MFEPKSCIKLCFFESDGLNNSGYLRLIYQNVYDDGSFQACLINSQDITEFYIVLLL